MTQKARADGTTISPAKYTGADLYRMVQNQKQELGRRELIGRQLPVHPIVDFTARAIEVIANLNLN